MRNRLVLALAAAIVAGCATLADESSTPSAAHYRAVGTEPGWTVEIDGGTMALLLDYGERRIVAPAPTPRTTFNGHRYETRAEGQPIVVDVTHQPCSDGMSDLRYPDRVIVTVGDRTYNGCGGPPTNPQQG